MVDTIVISKAEYERLIEAAEDLEDIKSVQDYLADPKPGLPAAYVDRLLEGETLLKLWREYRDLSQSALSRLSGVNRNQIIDIEKGRKTGSVNTLAKLADALELSIDALIDMD